MSLNSGSLNWSFDCINFYCKKNNLIKKERFPNATIVYSAILPREHDNEIIRDVNKQMMSAQGVEHFSAYRVFENSRQYYKHTNNR